MFNLKSNNSQALRFLIKDQVVHVLSKKNKHHTLVESLLKDVKGS